MLGILPEHFNKIRALEKELLKTEDEKKKDIKSEIKVLREKCITDYKHYVSNLDMPPNVPDIYTGREYLDELIIFYEEAFKYKRDYDSKDVGFLLRTYENQLEIEFSVMLEQKYEKVFLAKYGGKDDFLFTEESLRKVSNYRKKALKLSGIGDDFEKLTGYFTSREWDMLRFEAHGYFVRGNTSKALDKYECLLEDVRFQDPGKLSDIHYDIGDIYESVELYKYAISSYENARSFSDNEDGRVEASEKIEEINELLNKLENPPTSE